MDVDRSTASASARSSGKFSRSSEPNGYSVRENGRNGRQSNVGRSLKSLFKVSKSRLPEANVQKAMASSVVGTEALRPDICKCSCSAINTSQARDGSILRTS